MKNNKEIYRMITAIIYLIGILTCVTCNYIIEHNLSWSLIVIIGICMSYTITNLPFYYDGEKHKWLFILAIFNVLIYAMVCTISFLYGGEWLVGSLILTTVMSLIVWINILFCTFTKFKMKNKMSFVLLSMSLITIISNPLAKLLFEVNGTCIYSLVFAAILALSSAIVYIVKK